MLKNSLKPRKMRSAAVWRRLTPDQAALPDNWLLDKRPRPRFLDVLARIATHSGFKSCPEAGTPRAFIKSFASRLQPGAVNPPEKEAKCAKVQQATASFSVFQDISAYPAPL